MKVLNLVIVFLVVLAVCNAENICGGCGCDIHHCHCEFKAEECSARGIPVFGQAYKYDGHFKNDIKMPVDNLLKTQVLMASNQQQFSGYVPTLYGGYIKTKDILGKVFQRIV